MEIRVVNEISRVNVTVLHISGKIDSSTHQEFQNKADAVIDSGARYILVNFSELEFISSAGLRVLHNIFNKLRSLHQDVNDDELRKKMSAGGYKSPYLKLSNLPLQAKEVFELSGFDTYIESYSHQEKAILSF